jgi:outer membrane receptor protein involved in Fe transport
VLFDIAAFDIDWKDIQVGTATSSNLQYITNGGKANSQGVEVTTAFRPTDNLRLGLNGTWTDAKLGDEVTPLNASGNRLPYIPKFSALGDCGLLLPARRLGRACRRRLPLGRGPRADIQNQTQTHLDSYGAFDLNADVSNVNWTIRAYLKNATDERAYLNKSDINDLLRVTDRISAVPIQPRTFGVEVDYKVLGVPIRSPGRRPLHGRRDSGAAAATRSMSARECSCPRRPMHLRRHQAPAPAAALPVVPGRYHRGRVCQDRVRAA